MDDPRMGLGTDQLALPRQLAAGMPALPAVPLLPTQRSEGQAAAAAEHHESPDEAALASLAPWARQMLLPGIDT